MNGKRLSIEDLERLPMGTKVSVSQGLYYYDYIVSRDSDNKLCLRDDRLLVKLFYQDILKMDVYEYTRETSVKHMDSFGATPYIITGNNDIAKKMLDDWNNISWGITNVAPMYDNKSYKPESRIIREFNIAKKKEFDVKPLNGNEKYKLNKARLEFLVDIALEENNEEDFIKYGGKLKKYYNKEIAI